MTYNIQHQLELRKFKSVKRFLSSLSDEQLQEQLHIMLHVYNVVMWDEQIPADVKEEILTGISFISQDYAEEVENVQEKQQEQLEVLLQHRTPEDDYNKAIKDYGMMYRMMRDKYVAGDMDIHDYCNIQVSFGDLERNLNALKRNIENIS